MPDVELPDGTIIEDVPEGTTKGELMRRLGKMGDELELAPQPSALGTFAKAAGGRVVNNVLGFPDLLLTLGANRQMGSNPRPGGFPEVGDQVLPIPRLDAVSDEAEQRFPKSNFAGELTGDVATLLTGRLGVRTAAERSADKPSAMMRGKEVGPYIGSGARRVLDDFTRRVIKTHIPRGAKRVAETGFEGATLAALHSEDPIEAGGYAAGIQAGSSIMQTLAKPLVTGRAAQTIVGGFIAFEVAKSLIPGGQSDDVLDSISSAIDKTIPMFALGVAASATTKRFNPSGSFAKNLPKLADAIETVPRGMMLSAVNDIIADESGNTGRVVEQFAKNPEQFGPGAMIRLQRAIEEGRVGEEVQSLMQVPEFARQVLRNEQMNEEVLPRLRLPNRAQE